MHAIEARDLKAYWFLVQLAAVQSVEVAPEGYTGFLPVAAVPALGDDSVWIWIISQVVSTRNKRHLATFTS